MCAAIMSLAQIDATSLQVTFQVDGTVDDPCCQELSEISPEANGVYGAMPAVVHGANRGFEHKYAFSLSRTFQMLVSAPLQLSLTSCLFED